MRIMTIFLIFSHAAGDVLCRVGWREYSKAGVVTGIMGLALAFPWKREGKHFQGGMSATLCVYRNRGVLLGMSTVRHMPRLSVYRHLFLTVLLVCSTYLLQ